jgi:hypothetical protein
MDVVLTPGEFDTLQETASRMAISVPIAHERYLISVGLVERTGLGLLPTPAGYARLRQGR